MSLLILIGGVGALVVLVVLLILKNGRKRDSTHVTDQIAQLRPAVRRVGTSRVAAANRARARREAQQDIEEDESEPSDGDASVNTDAFEGKNIGVKKRKKLEMKAEKKAAREAELQERERRKLREAELEEERKKAEEMLKELELKKEEAEKKRQEEQERQEYEEYLKLKEQFVVDEEGFNANVEETDEENLLQKFVSYIKEQKVMVIEDLASHFKLKTQEAIDRLKSLQETGALTGVIDDRGKFLYISEEELKAVAKFIRQRGRVSLSELVDSSNILLNMTPVTT